MSINNVNMVFQADISNSSSGFYVAVRDGSLRDIIHAFTGDSILGNLPDGVIDFCENTVLYGSLRYDSNNGWLGEISFTYAKTNQLSIWFKYEASDKFAVLIRLAEISALGDNAKQVAETGYGTILKQFIRFTYYTFTFGPLSPSLLQWR